MKLDTIQKKEKLNEVEAIGAKGNGGAFHDYMIANQNNKVITHLRFQNGARHLEGSIEGVLDQDLLEIVRHRLQCFQAGEFNCEYNAEALKHIEKSLEWLNKRVEDRIKRNVLGKEEK